MIRWPWKRDKRLDQAQQQLRDVRRKAPRREELARRAEAHLQHDLDPFGQAFHRALRGGQP